MVLEASEPPIAPLEILIISCGWKAWDHLRYHGKSIGSAQEHAAQLDLKQPLQNHE